ncbi:type II secretion system protein [Lacticaseibacillus rhamnosus]|uniref:type II secretion system protein n=1 Tax=Lacticaseibacillus rhamnosus TaxID=47715 RepID=UPI001951BC94|nr:type II secretion system protein [Lacticaseibacillus rhamnosus]
MKRLAGFTLIEVVAVMFVVTALAIVAVPVGRNVLTQYREREFMETLVEEWEMLKMRARAEPSDGNMYVNGKEREVKFVTQGKTKSLIFPVSLRFDGEARVGCNPNGKIKKAGTLNFSNDDKKFAWVITFQLGWGRAILTKK